MVLNKRQIERNSNIMLNPLLRKACKMDIPKFCKDVEMEMKSNPTAMEGKIIGCLRGQFSKRQPVSRTQFVFMQVQGVWTFAVPFVTQNRETIKN